MVFMYQKYVHQMYNLGMKSLYKDPSFFMSKKKQL